jgi:hypothetical protein
MVVSIVSGLTNKSFLLKNVCSTGFYQNQIVRGAVSIAICIDDLSEAR